MKKHDMEVNMFENKKVSVLDILGCIIALLAYKAVLELFISICALFIFNKYVFFFKNPEGILIEVVVAAAGAVIYVLILVFTVLIMAIHDEI